MAISICPDLYGREVDAALEKMGERIAQTVHIATLHCERCGGGWFAIQRPGETISSALLRASAGLSAHLEEDNCKRHGAPECDRMNLRFKHQHRV